MELLGNLAPFGLQRSVEQIVDDWDFECQNCVDVATRSWSCERWPSFSVAGTCNDAATADSIEEFGACTMANQLSIVLN